MIDPKYTELMNLELDGAASETQRQELRHFLASNPDAAAHFEELGRLARRLDTHPLTEPPAQLHPRIMAAVDHAVRAPAHAPGFAGWLAGMFATPGRRTLSTFGLGLATGVFLLAAVQFGRSGSWEASRGVDPSAISGTMAKPAAAPQAEIVLDPAVDGVGGLVELSTEHGVTTIRARLEAPDPVGWTLVFDADPAESVLLKVVRDGEVVVERTASPIH